MSCIDCTVKNCDKGDKTYPAFCLTTHMDQEILQDALACYAEEENHAVMVAAAEVEYEHYCKYTRVEEIMAFAKRSGRRRSVSPPAWASEREPDFGGDFAEAWL